MGGGGGGGGAAPALGGEGGTAPALGGGGGGTAPALGGGGGGTAAAVGGTGPGGVAFRPAGPAWLPGCVPWAPRLPPGTSAWAGALTGLATCTTGCSDPCEAVHWGRVRSGTRSSAGARHRRRGTLFVITTLGPPYPSRSLGLGGKVSNRSPGCQGSAPGRSHGWSARLRDHQHVMTRSPSLQPRWTVHVVMYIPIVECRCPACGALCQPG